MIIRELNVYDFRDAFRDCGRKDQFSYEGLAALYEYLDDYSEETGTPIELDVIALCCDFSEYDSALECVTDCGYLPESDIEGDDDDERTEFCLEYLRDNTIAIECDNGHIIIQDF